MVKAYLYWAADLSQGVSDDAGCPRTGHAAPGGNSPDNNNLYRTVELQIGGGSYATINATDPNRDGRWNSVASWYSQPGNCPGSAYQVRADVTDQLSNALLAGRFAEQERISACRSPSRTFRRALGATATRAGI